MRKFTFQYLSDLHLEKKLEIPVIKQIADNLILAGDIGHPTSDIYKEFFSSTSKKYNKIYIVDGNHEWDLSTIPDKNRFKKFENIYLLENETIIHEDKILIAGCTLWTPTTSFEKNLTSVNFFQNIKCTKYKKIFISHHLPSYEMIVPKYKSYKNINRFANHLDHLLYDEKYHPDVFISGHSHCIFNKKIGFTRCMINTFYTKPTFFNI